MSNKDGDAPHNASGGGNATIAHLKARVRAIDADTTEIERQLYDLETSYFTDHSSNGNILRGFEAALAQTTKSGTGVGGGSGVLKKVKPFKADERLFSVSSATSQVNEELTAESEAVRTTASGRLAKAPSAFGGR